MTLHLQNSMQTSSIADDHSSENQGYSLVNKIDNSYGQYSNQAKYDQFIKKSSLSDEEREFVNWYESRRTISEQIIGNVQELSVTNQMFEIGTNKSRKPTKEQRDYADKVICNKPAGISEMAILTQVNGLKLKIVDDTMYAWDTT